MSIYEPCDIDIRIFSKIKVIKTAQKNAPARELVRLFIIQLKFSLGLPNFLTRS
jgi:hypothetical protein